jgi:hypothetical protein
LTGWKIVFVVFSQGFLAITAVQFFEGHVRSIKCTEL